MKRDFEIRKLRNGARLTLKQVASTLNRTGEWLRQVETGHLAVSSEVRAKIVEAIRRLAEYRSASQQSVRQELADLRLGYRGKF